MFNSDPSTRRRRLAGLIAVAAFAAWSVPTTAEAQPGQNNCQRRNNNKYDKLLECVTLAGVREHQAALQAIADANAGTRADQTPGYEASVDYVVKTLKKAGWDVDRVPFTYQVGVAELEQLTPVQATYQTGGYTGTGLGDVQAAVVAVDINLTPPRANTSGCDGAFAEAAVGAPLVAHPEGPDDFAGFPAGAIALTQRGGCSFTLKAHNAQAAGASAVIIFNQGDTPAREVVFVGNAAAPANSAVGPLAIPVVGSSFADGAALSQPGSTARISVRLEDRFSENVIAEKEGRRRDNIVMAGAHLDSVPAGPGINDNGSGSAALLELAQNLESHRPYNTLRFAWWGAEELGLIGSTAWVNSLSQEQLDEIALYLNFDMIGSSNYFIGVYDADESSFDAPVPVPEGSIALEDVFESYYTLVGEPYDDTPFSGRSDYQAFINHDIPASGLFTGAEVIKRPEQQAVWGGTVGAQFDPCYHIACDTFANNSDHALDVNADAVAFAVLTFAYSTESVNGVVGRPVPDSQPLPAPAGPEGTCPVAPPLPASCG
ncbi:MAG TPA: M28 family metallopeptidase [Ilumatobacteraceae bacterium]|nr:M28 family metallopeptidase [Ilumatobacteraceae bacterium]